MVHDTSQFQKAVLAVKNGDAPEKAASALLQQMTDTERLNLLFGDTPFYEGLMNILINGYGV